jgi:hypothetical protein
MDADKGKRSLRAEKFASVKTGLIEGNKPHLNMHIYYRLMTRQNYQTTVGKRSLTPPPRPPLEEG